MEEEEKAPAGVYSQANKFLQVDFKGKYTEDSDKPVVIYEGDDNDDNDDLSIGKLKSMDLTPNKTQEGSNKVKFQNTKKKHQSSRHII